MTSTSSPVTLADLERAGFVFLDKVEARKNHDVRFLIHRQVLDMPPDQQAREPWIELGHWADRLNYPDFIEGRWGSIRYSLRGITDLREFMGYWRYNTPGINL